MHTNISLIYSAFVEKDGALDDPVSKLAVLNKNCHRLITFYFSDLFLFCLDNEVLLR